jgi:cAMP-dependent protein kinase regulator
MGSYCSKADSTNNGGDGVGSKHDQYSAGGFRETRVFLTTVADAAKKGADKANHHLRVVFATPFELDWNSNPIPQHEKSVEEEMLLKTALKRNFVFEELSDKEIRPLILAFERETVEAGTVIIKQHDVGDYFYIIQYGECSFTVDGKRVGTAKAGASFGELALLYNCPRAATVTAVTKTELFRVDQKTFRHVLNSQSKQHEDDKLKLLKGVPFLKGLGTTELSKLASVMTPKLFKKGEYLFRKGDA